MRTSALSQPPQALFPQDSGDASFDREVPRESLTRLIVPRDEGGQSHTRPTTPVPADYFFLAQHSGDEAYARILAGRLEGLADELSGDDADRAGCDESQDTPWTLEEEITRTRARTIVPDGRRSSAPPQPRPGGIFAIMASMALVPFLRRGPRQIPRGTIDHGKACVLALIDGHTSIEQILDTSPMPVPRVLRILSDLLESGVVGLSD
jgi:hypothetical protein